MNLDDKLEYFISNIPVMLFVNRIHDASSYDKEHIKNLVLTFINEARETLRFLSPYLNKEDRILEVGAGLCIFSLFLKNECYDIVALEPALGGYELFSVSKDIIIKYYQEMQLDILEMKAEDINRKIHGKFDLVYSSNVIEHIPHFDKTLDALTNILSCEGKMVHSCPNYFIPYDPHFQIPVFKKMPELSISLFGNKITSLALWRSLNFISYFDLTLYAKHRDIRLSFEKGLLYQAFRRLDTDIYFEKRHSGLNSIYKFLKVTRLIYLLQYLPAYLSTPMVFQMIPSKKQTHI